MIRLKLISGSNMKLKTKCSITDPTFKKAIKVGHALEAFMKRHSCLGVASNQFGIMERVCAAKIFKGDPRNDQSVAATGKIRVFVDPHIIKRTGRQISKNEGCLTWPGIRGNVYRHKEIKVEHIVDDGDGGQYGIESTFTGLNAIIIEHEIEHLDGIRCVDRMKNKTNYGKPMKGSK